MRLVVAILDALQDASHTNLNKLVEIARGNRKKFDPFEQRIALILSLFENSLVEAQPGVVAADEQILDNFRLGSGFAARLVDVFFRRGCI